MVVWKLSLSNAFDCFAMICRSVRPMAQNGDPVLVEFQPSYWYDRVCQFHFSVCQYFAKSDNHPYSRLIEISVDIILVYGSWLSCGHHSGAGQSFSATGRCCHLRWLPDGDRWTRRIQSNSSKECW